MSKDYHVVPDGDDWAVRAEASQRASGKFDTQAEAIARGRELAQDGGSLTIHRPDGTIREERTYRDDPYPPKG